MHQVDQRTLHDDLVERRHDVQVLGDRQEPVRRQHAVAWMVPADQRLDPAELQRFRVELRLIPGREFATLDAFEDFVGNALAVDDLRLKGLAEEFVPVAALLLGTVKRDIGIDQQPPKIGVLTAADGNPDTDAEATRESLVIDGLAHPGDDPVGERFELPRNGVRHENDELVAADPRDQIVGPGLRLENLRGVNQHGITCGMAERIVDLFEAVEVEMQQRHIGGAPGVPVAQSSESGIEHAPVAEPGQGVVKRVVLDPVLGGGKLRRLRLGKRLGVHHRVRQAHVFGNVPAEAGHRLTVVGPRIDRADVADMARARRQHDAIIGLVRL